jgi:hypothetical protein
MGIFLFINLILLHHTLLLLFIYIYIRKKNEHGVCESHVLNVVARYKYSVPEAMPLRPVNTNGKVCHI